MVSANRFVEFCLEAISEAGCFEHNWQIDSWGSGSRSGKIEKRNPRNGSSILVGKISVDYKKIHNFILI